MRAHRIVRALAFALAGATLAVRPALATHYPQIAARSIVVEQRAPQAQPAILGITLRSYEVHAGDVVHAAVTTSSNVASVEARVASYGFALSRVGVGRFAFVYRVPSLPFFLHRSWPVEVIARNATGVATVRSFMIAYR